MKKLTEKQVMSIPSLINDQKLSIGAVAKSFGVSWQCIWFWIGRLQKEGVKINKRKRGHQPLEIKKQ